MRGEKEGMETNERRKRQEPRVKKRSWKESKKKRRRVEKGRN